MWRERVTLLAAIFVIGLAANCGDEEEPTPPLSGGRFWVIDQPNNEVYVYDYGGQRLLTVGQFPFFMKPNCVDVDRRDGLSPRGDHDRSGTVHDTKLTVYGSRLTRKRWGSTRR